MSALSVEDDTPSRGAAADRILAAYDAEGPHRESP
jgi:hypothetical protein